MNETIVIADLENRMEATILSDLLSEQGIPHMIQEHSDSAYGSVAYMGVGGGWGHISAPEEYRDYILSLLADIRSSFRGFEE